MDALQGAIDVDTNIFFSINRMHNMYFDYFMSAYSGKWVWIPMYAAGKSSVSCPLKPSDSAPLC